MRSQEVEKVRWIMAAKSPSSEAAIMVAGRQRASSAAMVGPERAASRRGAASGLAWRESAVICVGRGGGVVVEGGAADLRRGKERRGLDALGDGGEGGGRGDGGAEAGPDVAGELDGDGGDDEVGIFEGGVGIGDADSVGDLEAGEA